MLWPLLTGSANMRQPSLCSGFPDVSSMMSKTTAIQIVYAWLLACIPLLPAWAGAAPVPDTLAVHRPRICLVLSGGGARGAAHVGVLLALKKLHIPVDCIAGTSMGAIVGGLYAAGMPAQELRSVLMNPKIQAEMSDNTPRSLLSYRQKEDQLKYLLRVELGYAGGRFFLPQGIISGNDPSRVLNVLALASNPSTDFSKLPIPFRAVATDIDTGQEVVLKHGNLAEAMRASMSVPGVYPPVRYQGHLLVDGGLVDNLPVDVARAMGANVIIAVNITTPLSNGHNLNDVVGVSLQVIKILGYQNVTRSITALDSSDVLIEPNLDDISPTDFNRMGAAIRLGEQAALKALAPHTNLMLTPDAYAGYAKRHRHPPGPPARVDFVEIRGNRRVSVRLIKSRFAVAPGTRWNLDAIDAGLRRVYALGYFQRLDVSLVRHGSRTGIKLVVKEKPWRPNYLQFGLHLTDDFEGDSYYELLGAYSLTELNRLGGEWRNEFEIGKTRLYYTELYQPLTYGGSLFFAPQVEYLNDTFDLFSGEERLAEYGTVYPHAGFEFGGKLGNAGELRLGLSYGHAVSQPRIGAATLPSYRNTLSATTLRLNIDTFNVAGFPSSGSYLMVSGFFPRRSLGGDITYNKLDVSAGQAFGDGVHNLLLLAEAGSSFGSTLPIYDQFSLGGFLSLDGLRPGQLRGDKVFDAHMIYAQRVATLPAGIGKGLYLGGSLDAGNIWASNQHLSASGLQYGASLFLGLDTVLGPLYLGAGFSQSGKQSFFLYLGIPINAYTLAPSFNN